MNIEKISKLFLKTLLFLFSAGIVGLISFILINVKDEYMYIADVTSQKVTIFWQAKYPFVLPPVISKGTNCTAAGDSELSSTIKGSALTVVDLDPGSTYCISTRDIFGNLNDEHAFFTTKGLQTNISFPQPLSGSIDPLITPLTTILIKDQSDESYISSGISINNTFAIDYGSTSCFKQSSKDCILEGVIIGEELISPFALEYDKSTGDQLPTISLLPSGVPSSTVFAAENCNQSVMYDWEALVASPTSYLLSPGGLGGDLSEHYASSGNIKDIEDAALDQAYGAGLSERTGHVVGKSFAFTRTSNKSSYPPAIEIIVHIYTKLGGAQEAWTTYYGPKTSDWGAKSAIADFATTEGEQLLQGKNPENSSYNYLASDANLTYKIKLKDSNASKFASLMPLISAPLKEKIKSLPVRAHDGSISNLADYGWLQEGCTADDVTDDPTEPEAPEGPSTHNETLSLIEGWNLVSFPDNSYTGEGSVTAESVLKSLKSLDADIEYIVSFENEQFFPVKILGNKFYGENFEIQKGAGYFVKLGGKYEVQWPLLDEGVSLTEQKQLSNHWNLVGLPDQSSTLSSTDLYDQYMASLINVTDIATISSGTYKHHLLKGGDTYGTEFILDRFSGYWIYIDE